MSQLQGKTALITGASNGIGRATAIQLAAHGAYVILACRSEKKTVPVLETIRAAGGKADFLPLDLGDLTSVRHCAEAFLARGEPLAILINNAGLGGGIGLTKDGFELLFGTNYLGHYLLTRLLLPAIERAGYARIVNVSSRTHYFVNSISWDTLRKPAKTLAATPEYSWSKLANVLFTKELVRHVPKEIHTYAVHPGLVASDIWGFLPWGLRHLKKLFKLSNEEGAKSILYCAMSDEVRDQTGLYYDQCKQKEPNKLAFDEALARELWDRSAAWVGLSP